MLLARYIHTYHSGRARWECGLGRSLTAKEWESPYYRARHTTCNMHLTDTFTKLVTYWYYTPNTYIEPFQHKLQTAGEGVSNLAP